MKEEAREEEEARQKKQRIRAPLSIKVPEERVGARSAIKFSEAKPQKIRRRWGKYGLPVGRSCAGAMIFFQSERLCLTFVLPKRARLSG